MIDDFEVNGERDPNVVADTQAFAAAMLILGSLGATEPTLAHRKTDGSIVYAAGCHYKGGWVVVSDQVSKSEALDALVRQVILLGVACPECNRPMSAAGATPTPEETCVYFRVLDQWYSGCAQPKSPAPQFSSPRAAWSD